MRPSAGKKTSNMLKSAREIVQPERVPITSLRVEEESDLDTQDDADNDLESVENEPQRKAQESNLQHCESILAAIQKESSQNSSRYYLLRWIWTSD